VEQSLGVRVPSPARESALEKALRAINQLRKMPLSDRRFRDKLQSGKPEQAAAVRDQVNILVDRLYHMWYSHVSC